MCYLLPSENYTHFSHSSWRDRDHDFCGIWAGSNEGDGLQDFMEQKQAFENSLDCGMKKELRVTTHLQLIEDILEECATYTCMNVGPAEKIFHSSILYKAENSGLNQSYNHKNLQNYTFRLYIRSGALLSLP